MRPRYCRSADSRMRMQNALLFLSDKEESWITSMLVLGLKDLLSKERLMVRERSLEKTLPAACIVETSKQHMKSLI